MFGKIIGAALGIILPTRLPRVSKERRIIGRCIQSGNVDELVEYLRDNRVFYARQIGYGDMVSVGGGITYCSDIYGSEVKLWSANGKDRGLLDCNPSGYNLSRQEANRAYNAVLERVRQDMKILSCEI